MQGVEPAFDGIASVLTRRLTQQAQFAGITIEGNARAAAFRLTLKNVPASAHFVSVSAGGRGVGKAKCVAHVKA
jgi:hypothetical protein